MSKVVPSLVRIVRGKAAISVLLLLAALVLLQYVYWPLRVIGMAVGIIVLMVRYRWPRPGAWLALCTLAIMLGVSEMALRSAGRYASYSEATGAGGYMSPFEGPHSGWYQGAQPHQRIHIRSHEFNNEWTANNEGLKDKDFDTVKTGKRILVIGDSYAEGVGAAIDSSMARQLGYILRDSLREPTEVWNCGVAGFDLIYDYRLLHDRLLRYQPDMIVVLMNSSDIHDVVMKGSFERFHADGTIQFRQAPWFLDMYAESYLVREIVHDGLRYDWEFLQPGESERAHARALEVLTGAMDSISLLCSSRRIPLLFAIHPMAGEFSGTVPDASLPLIAYARDSRLPYVDVRQSLHAQGATAAHYTDLYWPGDGHCRDKGYRYFARSVWRRVAEMLQAAPTGQD